MANGSGQKLIGPATAASPENSVVGAHFAASIFSSPLPSPTERDVNDAGSAQAGRSGGSGAPTPVTRQRGPPPPPPMTPVRAIVPDCRSTHCRTYVAAMTIEALLSRLEGVRQTGARRWIARCASHDDRHPSLALHELEDGRVLLHCFAGCVAEDVLAAIGLTFEALFPQRAMDHKAPESAPAVPALRRFRDRAA